MDADIHGIGVEATALLASLISPDLLITLPTLALHPHRG
jgi:hypothetical protein